MAAVQSCTVDAAYVCRRLRNIVLFDNNVGSETTHAAPETLRIRPQPHQEELQLSGGMYMATASCHTVCFLRGTYPVQQTMGFGQIVTHRTENRIRTAILEGGELCSMRSDRLRSGFGEHCLGCFRSRALVYNMHELSWRLFVRWMYMKYLADSYLSRGVEHLMRVCSRAALPKSV